MDLSPKSTLSWDTLDFPSRALFPAFVPLSNSDAGALLYLERERADQVNISLHVRDRSKTASNLGAEVPVVRERDFRVGRIIIPWVVPNSGYRYALRVYDPDNVPDASVVVRLFQTTDRFGEYLLDEATFPLTNLKITTNCEDAVCPWPGGSYAPSILFLPLDLSQYDSAAIRVEIEAVSPGLRLWAMVSATNNETHLVTIYSPN
jgi:hypothetical protein